MSEWDEGWDEAPRAHVNTTKQNILRKKRIIARRRRRRFFGCLFLLVLAAALMAGLLFVGYAAYSWGTELYHDCQTMYAAYTERQKARRGEISPAFDGYTNVLVLGLDAGASEEGEPTGTHADTVLFLSMENATGRVRFITIPRNTWVTYPTDQGGHGKIRDLYALGGAPLVVRSVRTLLGGVSIHQYVTVDMQTFADLIDALGGIDLYVESDMNYDDPEDGTAIHLEQGYQHLSGEQAQQYLRYRSPELGEVGRVQRQQKFVRALYRRLLQVRTIPKLPAIAEILRDRVDTSAEIFDSAHLAHVVRALAADEPQSLMLPGSPAHGDASIWVPDDSGIEKKMDELFVLDASALGTE